MLGCLDEIHMEKNNKEHLALYTGFVLILLVLVFTMFRSDMFSSEKNTDSKQDYGLNSKSADKPDYPTISSNDLQKKLLINNKKQGITLLDIRPFEAFAEEHILDAVGISLDEFPVSQNIDKHDLIVVIGQNSGDGDIAKAVENLKKEDFENIIVLAGGMELWKQMLGATVSYGNPKSFVDQSKVSYLDPEQLNDAIKSEVPLYIVDVRSNEDYKNGHIKGAINIPFDELEKRRSEITERKVVVIGINELQEFQASVQMYDMLLVSPFVMRTAIPGWQSKGFELTK